MSQVKVLDPHAQNLLQLNEQFDSILNAPVPTAPTDRAARLEEMEQVAFGYFKEASNAYERGWNIIFLIIESELWKEKRDHNGNPFTNYADYVQSLYEDIGKFVSQRTIHSRITQFRTLGNLGVDPAARTQAIEQMPYVVSKLMGSVVDRRTGEIKELEPLARKQMLEAVGITGVEGTEITDRKLIAEFVEILPELGHRDASKIVSRLIAEWKERFHWFKRDNILVIRFYQAGKSQKTKKEVRFKYLGGDLEDPIVQDWLKRMVQS